MLYRRKHEFQKLIRDLRNVLEELGNKHTILASPSANQFFFKSSKPVPQKKVEYKLEKKEIPLINKAPIEKVASKTMEAVKKEDDPILKLEPLSTITIEPIKELEQIVRQAAPYLTVTPHIPDDSLAKKISSMWKEQNDVADAVILFFNESNQEIHFLKNLVKAIDISLVPAKLLDIRRLEKKWDLFLDPARYKIKLMIASTQTIHKCPELKRHYKEIPSTSQFFLGNIPLLLLSPFSSYFKTPLLKRSLWQKLCQILKN